jgi:hypothetical protein
VDSLDASRRELSVMYASNCGLNLWVRIAVGAKRMAMKIEINRRSRRSRRTVVSGNTSE